jgi:biopolymer transport protein ExbB
MSQLLSLGGFFSWILLASLAIALAISLERWGFYLRAAFNVREFMGGVSSLVRRKNWAEALHESLATQVPAGRVMHAVLLRHKSSRDELRQIAQEAAQLEVPNIERNLMVVYTVTHAAPLVGLLGTIFSLFDGFAALKAEGAAASPTQMAAGIYSSLVCTGMGLTVAIISLCAYMLLLNRAAGLINELQRAGTEIVNLIMDGREDNSIVTFPSAAAATLVSPPAPADDAEQKILDATPEIKAAKPTKRSKA